MYKVFFGALLALFLLLPASFTLAATPTEKPLKAAIVFNRSVKELDDQSFISIVRAGAERASKELAIPLQIYQQDASESDRKFLSNVAEDGADVIIGMSFTDTAPLLDMAEQYPDVKFVVIDSVLPPLYTNAKSVVFREHEGSFLVGMLAALKSKSGKVGFIGGRDLPLIHNFANGYKQGAEYANPGIEVTVQMIGKDSDAWNSPDKAAEIAEAQIRNGVDVIFAAAGASGLGVLKTVAAHDGTYAIGVDSNQNALYPGHVLTSMTKRVDVAIYEALKDVKNDHWEPGILNLGLKENGLDYAVDENNESLLDEAMINEVENARDKIIDGTLVVHLYNPNSKH